MDYCDSSISGLPELLYCDSMLMTCLLSQLELSSTHDPAMGNANCAHVGGTKRLLGVKAVGASWVCCRGARRFSSGGADLSKASDKNGGLF